MPKVAYSPQQRQRIREALVREGLALMAAQGVQHTTIEHVCRAVGISRTFFYSFFPSKEDLVVEALYLQQPRILAYAQSLMDNPSLGWREGVQRFLFTCCYGEKNGISVLTIEEQQMIFHRLTPDSRRTFRQKQARLFAGILQCFGIQPDAQRVNLFINLSLSAMIVRKGIPDTLPFFVPEAADAAVQVQINAITDCLEAMKKQARLP